MLFQRPEEHLRRALDAAFPIAGSSSREPALARTRALLALRELADVHGRRTAGLPTDALARAIGEDGKEALDKLATPSTRLVVMEEHPEGWRYALAHDRMAELLVTVVEEEGRYGQLGVDAELVALRRFVVLQTELYVSGDSEQATRVPRHRFQSIEDHAGVLLWGADRQRWWAACRQRRRADRRRAWTRRAIAAAMLILVAAATWAWADRRARRRALYAQVAEGAPEAALQAFDRLAARLLAAAPEADREELRSRLRRRGRPMDLLELGMGAFPEDRRAAAVLRAVEIALPLVDETPEDPVLIANLVWALDYAPGREPGHAARARELRDRVLAPLRRRRPPPPISAARDPDWADVPGGSFRMGSAPGADPQAGEDAGPEYRVTVSPFRMLTHEVTNQQYRRLVPDHQGIDDLPTGVTWYEACTYAAWLGGRLPTEAEWEHAARAGCPYEYCTHQGEETTLDEVAWIRRNSVPRDSPPEDDSLYHPVSQREPNPWGLFDMYGNAAEWIGDWAAEYPAAAVRDPWGPATGARRIERGGASWYPEADRSARATARGARPPGQASPTRQGFRVVLAATGGDP